jgi:hypothetical protein
MLRTKRAKATNQLEKYFLSSFLSLRFGPAHKHVEAEGGHNSA